jgi:hypothetical protein
MGSTREIRVAGRARRGGVNARGTFGLAVWVAACVAAAAPSYRPPDAGVLDAVLDRSRGLTVAERIVAVTDPLLGAPYVLGPLGEGAPGGPDDDPRVRYDAFDCTTFVETAMALSLVDRSQDVESLLDVIRYRDATPSFSNRRHFPAAEWLPELVQLGFLEDITRTVARGDVVVETTILSPWVWNRRRTKILDGLPAERIPNGKFPLDVWLLDAALAGYRAIPSGTVLSIVRTDRPRLPVRITHQGLVIVRDGEHILRHAAEAPFDRVVDEPLRDYLKRVGGYREWSVVGVHLARVRPPDGVHERLGTD